MANNQYKRLMVADLSEGDTLVFARVASFGGHLVEDSEWVISKITKTRLVLDRMEGNAQKRMIVRDGEVTNYAEGDPHRRYYTPLYTPDDDHLAAIREGGRRAHLKADVRRAAERFAANPDELARARDLQTAMDEWVAVLEKRSKVS
jgi:hypothetical protein